MSRYKQSDTVRLLFTKGQPLLFEKAHIIIGNEDQPNGIYYITTGYVKVYSINTDGSQNIRIILGSGDVFPIIWAYLGTYNETLFYEAMSVCSLWRLSREWFLNLIEHDLAISNAMALQLAQQSSILTNRMENLEYRKARDRLVYRLLFLASRFGIREHGLLRIETPLTHEILASTINLTRESVSRELEKLEKENLIERSGHSIVIFDVQGLARLLNRPINLEDWRLLS
jgi:CRP/FNR family transcriptional regulator, cyclic AMP receptor protein